MDCLGNLQFGPSSRHQPLNITPIDSLRLSVYFLCKLQQHNFVALKSCALKVTLHHCGK